MLNFDGLLEKLRPFGRYQIIFYIVVGMTSSPAGMQTLLSVYLFATPRHWCHVPELANLSVDQQRLLTVPPGALTGNPSDESCYVYDVNYTEVYLRYVSYNDTQVIANASSFRECTQWGYDMELYGPTAVTEWDLVCSKSFMTTLASSSFMLGFLIGVSLFGYISDRIGRKLAWFIGLVVGVIFSTTATFMPEYWSFIILRMISGIALSGCYTVGFVLVMEMIGKEKRVAPGVAYQLWFTLGYVCSPAFAYPIKNYKWLNLTVSIIPALFIPYYWFIPESARWLLSTGRTANAKLEVCRMGKLNKIERSDTLMAFDRLVVQETEKGIQPERTYSMIDLLRTPNMRSRALNVLFNWMVNSMVFYGISLGVADLAGNPYVNMVISGASECVGIVTAILTLNKLGRRWPLCVMMVFGGISCLAVNFLPENWRVFGTVLAMLGKFGIAGSFAIIYVFTAELFPTVVRTIAVGSGSMGARFGGLIAPFITELGDILWSPLPMLIFGSSALLGGCLSLLLPETLHQKLPETLEEGEEFGKRNKARIFALPKKSQVVV